MMNRLVQAKTANRYKTVIKPLKTVTKPPETVTNRYKALRPGKYSGDDLFSSMGKSCGDWM